MVDTDDAELQEARSDLRWEVFAAIMFSVLFCAFVVMGALVVHIFLTSPPDDMSDKVFIYGTFFVLLFMFVMFVAIAILLRKEISESRQIIRHLLGEETER